jgi:Asp-tRNA(Asn)/Glu-tRNA(Gln) amidotransferase A subunit family amidase
MDSSLFFEFSVSELLRQLREKKITPVEIAQETNKQIDSKNPVYKAFVVHDAEHLIKQAEAAQCRLDNDTLSRSLTAIPVGIKDIMNTTDYPTQMGSPLWRNFTPGNDARVVFNCLRQGALIAGKTVTAEFAVHTLNETLNPYDFSRTPGTSSSGSAVAVAAGMVPLALGTQTAGSIVRPASFCGIFGCKPSFGLIPRTGVLKTTDTLDTIGFFTSHAEDMILLFDAIRIRGPDYPLSNAALMDYSRQNITLRHPWRVAFVKTHTWEYVPSYAQAALQNFIHELSTLSDIEMQDITLPEEMKKAHDIHATIYNKCLAYYFEEEYKRAELVSPRMCELIARGMEITPSQFQDALDYQVRLCDIMDRFFSDYDILISLATAGEAPERNVEELPDPALMWTMTYLPVVCAPVFHGPNGLPFGLQIVARRYNDYKLFHFVEYLCEQGKLPRSCCENP